MAAERSRRREVLARVPQPPPFRFIDEILELDDDHIVARVPLRGPTPTSTAATSRAIR